VVLGSASFGYISMVERLFAISYLIDLENIIEYQTGGLMGLLSSLIGKKMSTEEMIKKTSFFLLPQVNQLEDNCNEYEYLLGQKGVYYILNLAETIAKRPISDNELMALLQTSFEKDKAISINNHYLMTSQHPNAHFKLKAQMKPIAKMDIENGMINSSNFLVAQYQLAKKSLDAMFE